eukprot:Hpha_TRINITY_DN15882_c1_g1::TRINITY_DN15882_c1_g1_i1::g.189210::m.189210
MFGFFVVASAVAAVAVPPCKDCGIVLARCDMTWASETIQSFSIEILDRQTVQIEAPEVTDAGTKWVCLSDINGSIQLSATGCNESVAIWTAKFDGPPTPGVPQKVVYSQGSRCLSIVGKVNSTSGKVGMVPCCDQQNCTEAQVAEQTWSIGNPGAGYPTMRSSMYFNDTNWCVTRVNGLKKCA